MPLSTEPSEIENAEAIQNPKSKIQNSDASKSTIQNSQEVMQRNLTALTLDVTCFLHRGWRFLDSSAVLPLLLQRLGASGPIIGSFAMLRSLTFSLSQIFVAYIAQGRQRHKPPLAWIAALTRLPLLVLPFALLHATDSPLARTLALAAAFALLGIWSLGDGLGLRFPWMEIVGAVVSRNGPRGPLFSLPRRRLRRW